MPAAIIRRIAFVYIFTIILLIAFPFSSSLQPEKIVVLDFRGDYLLHVLLFLLWMFFCNAMRFNIWL
jgi:hypothetical protein